jgi:hypothetical protein
MEVWEQSRQLGHLSCSDSIILLRTDAASSAVVVIGSLFDKKRTQLCAVWVTTSRSGTPLQILNNKVRKYDSLRGKYMSAYLDALRLYNRRTKIETFLRWSYSANRDLPSHFTAMAVTYGGAQRSASVT